MAFLGRLWDYVSPRKTQHKRDKEFKVPIVPLKKHAATPKPVPKPSRAQVTATPPTMHIATPPESRELSPQSRIKSWTTRTPSPLSDPDIDQAQLPPSPPTSAKHVDDNFEGETLVDSPTLRSSTTKTGSSGAEVDANEDTMVVEDGNPTDAKIDIDEETQRREQQSRELRAIGWSEDAVFLFQKLGMRGLEPILPMEWIKDLETLPMDLFTAKEDRVFLRPVHPANGASYRGTYPTSPM